MNSPSLYFMEASAKKELVKYECNLPNTIAVITPWTHDIIRTSLLRQNDVILT